MVCVCVYMYVYVCACICVISALLILLSKRLSFPVFPLRILPYLNRPNHSELSLLAVFIQHFLVFKYFRQYILYWIRTLVENKVNYTKIKLYSVPMLLTTCQNFHAFNHRARRIGWSGVPCHCFCNELGLPGADLQGEVQT